MHRVKLVSDLNTNLPLKHRRQGREYFFSKRSAWSDITMVCLFLVSSEGEEEYSCWPSTSPDPHTNAHSLELPIKDQGSQFHVCSSSLYSKHWHFAKYRDAEWTMATPHIKWQFSNSTKSEGTPEVNHQISPVKFCGHLTSVEKFGPQQPFGDTMSFLDCGHREHETEHNTQHCLKTMFHSQIAVQERSNATSWGQFFPCRTGENNYVLQMDSSKWERWCGK